ncbi:MAG TPA: sulfotransferase [Gemmatimonadaceae bacterium]|nr:sulfotransferase [Gemmatimonadaceae bacterium]
MPLPTFVIVGERKSGTTALCHWMAHPDVYMHPREDMNYFIEDEILVTTTWRDGPADPQRWERTHSAAQYAALFAEADGQRAIGEKSADLFFWRPAHERMARLLPEAKFIVLLRDPVKRAWSHYLDELAKGDGREALSFRDALSAESERSTRSAYARLHLSYRARGYYDDVMRDFLTHVPRERLLVLTLEQMGAAPRETLQTVYRFIGVDSAIGLEMAGTRHNEVGDTNVPRRWARWPVVRPIAGAYHHLSGRVIERLMSDPARRQRAKNAVYLPFLQSGKRLKMPVETRAELARDFSPHVRALEDLLDREFPEWTSTADVPNAGHATR